MTDTVTPLAAKRYTTLVRDIQKLLAAADSADNAQKVQVYWLVGQRIDRERLTHAAGYHNSVLRELCADTEIAVRTLQRAVRFHDVYKKPPTDTLTWSHYRLLLECTDDAERQRLRQLAIDQQLSARQLATACAAPTEHVASSKHALGRPTDSSYIYAATVHNIVDGDTLDLDIDLGFHTMRRGRFRLADIDAPETNRKGGREATRFITSRLVTARTVVVKTLRVDLHGRYVAHLFYSPRTLSIHDCFTAGTHLNSELVEQGHAEKVT